MKTKKLAVLSVVIAVALAVSALAFTACGEESSVKLDKTSVSLEVGKDVTLTATLGNENDEVVWSTSDDKVATVSGGKVTAVAAGTAVITAQAGDAVAECAVTVANKAVSDAEGLLSAVDNAQEGDVILINAGEYTINRTLMMDVDGVTLTANGDVTIKSADTWTTTDVGQHGLFTVVADNVTLEGFTVSGAKKHSDDGHGAGTGSGINVTYEAVSGGQDGSTGVVIRNVSSTDNAGCGIIVSSSEVTLENVTTEGNGWGGVNIAANYGAAELTVDEACSFGEAGQIYSDSGEVNITVNVPSDYRKVTSETSTVVVWTNAEEQA